MPEPQISIGSILIMHAEFERVARKETETVAVQRRAQILTTLLDELIEYRRKEAEHGAA